MSILQQGRTPANKYKGTVEATPRIYAQDVAGQEFDLLGALPGDLRGGGTVTMVEFRVLHDGKGGQVVELRTGPRVRVQLVRVPAGLGGCRLLWRCPLCGRNARHLYLVEPVPCCRRCAGLNYRVQQATKDYFAACDRAIEAYERLAPLPQGTSYHDVPRLYPPDKPKGMHQTTYERLLRRWDRARAQAREMELAEMRRLLGWLK